MTWSAAACTEDDLPAVLDLFTEPDFYFRTTRPDTRSEHQVRQLLGTDTRVLRHADEPVGLAAVAPATAEHSGHYRLHLRLGAAQPPQRWLAAHREVLRWLCWHTEVVRLSWSLAEYDARGLAVARASGMTEEGVLPDLLAAGEVVAGWVGFALLRPSMEPLPQTTAGVVTS